MVHRPEGGAKIFLRFSGSSSPFFFFAPGLEKLEVNLRNRLPPNIIPDTPVERELSISGESDRECVQTVSLCTTGLLLDSCPEEQSHQRIQIQETTSVIA